MPDEPTITPPPEDAPPEVPTDAQQEARYAHLRKANEARRILTPEAQKAMIEEYAAGETVPILAEKYGVATTHVYSVISRAKQTRRNRRPNVTEETKQKAARAYLAGEGTVAKIAKEYGVWPATLRERVAKERESADWQAKINNQAAVANQTPEEAEHALLRQLRRTREQSARKDQGNETAHECAAGAPKAPPGYHAAVGRMGGRRKTEAQRAARVKNISRAHKMTPEQRAKMLREYAAGASVAVLAERYGITPAHIYSTASRAGHTGRKRTPNVPEETKQKAARAYLAGEGSIAKIGKAYGIWPATLRVWIARERKAAEVAESEEK